GGRERLVCPGCEFPFFAKRGVGGAVVVLDDAGRVLMVQRGPGHFGAGLWCLPCGYVEWDEDVREAAAREALEEAGVAVEIGEVGHVATNPHEAERPTVGIWFAARLIDPRAEPHARDDAVAAGWVGPAPPPPPPFPT